MKKPDYTLDILVSVPEKDEGTSKDILNNGIHGDTKKIPLRNEH